MRRGSRRSVNAMSGPALLQSCKDQLQRLLQGYLLFSTEGNVGKASIYSPCMLQPAMHLHAPAWPLNRLYTQEFLRSCSANQFATVVVLHCLCIELH
jgi:hypothetical protein